MKTLVVKSELSKACRKALKRDGLDAVTKILLAELLVHLAKSISPVPSSKYH